jgi:hypothetical protein
MFSQISGIAGQVNAMLLRPFRQRVDIGNAALLFVLVLALAGQWHLVVEKVEG